MKIAEAVIVKWMNKTLRSGREVEAAITQLGREPIDAAELNKEINKAHEREELRIALAEARAYGLVDELKRK